MDKFNNQYRIPSTRLQDWNYGQNAAYFVTICTKKREPFFGKITDGKMELSQIGKIAEKYWMEIPLHFLFVKVDLFVIMPNHMHGIIIMDKQDDNSSVETPKLVVSTDTSFSQKHVALKKWKPGILGVIMNQYKRICTINARKINPCFAWQSRFYDHIIRDEKKYQQIAEYISNNPLRWQDDKYYAEG
jgi:REP element-mobilizing transposase RayT